MQHNLTFEPTKDGFRLIANRKDLTSCEFILTDDGFWLGSTDSVGWYPREDVPLYYFRNLLNSCVNLSYTNWSPLPDGKKSLWPVKKWAMEKTKKSLNHLVLEQWRKKVDGFDPYKREIHKKLFLVSPGNARNFSRLQKYFDNRHFMDDIIKYKAAASWLLNGSDYDPSYWGFVHEEPFDFADWLSNYCPDRKKYTSMNKTLMNLPNGIFYSGLTALASIKLPEPVTTRLKLIAYMNVAGSHSWKNNIDQYLGILARSSEQDVKDAVKFIWKHFPDKDTGDFRKTRKITDAIRIIFDYPPDSKVDIKGLAVRSEVYHHNEVVRRRIMQQEFEKRKKEFEEIKKSKTKLPPIALPDDPKIRFLSSYKDVENEGRHMGHCVESYAESAVLGKCYLFHVDHNGEEATVEVGNGFVKQSYGPHNCRNSASKYGEVALSQWAKLMK